MYSPRGAHVRISEREGKDLTDRISIEYVSGETTRAIEGAGPIVCPAPSF